MIFGANGFVGNYLYVKSLRQGFEVIGYDSKVMENMIKPIDISNSEAVNSEIKRFRPDWVVNTAAISNIDFAEAHKELAWLINVKSNQEMARICREHGSRFMVFSSDAVFRGDALKYDENSPTDPVNYYGYTKAEAEKAILALIPEATIIRISLVLGFPVESGNSFLVDFNKKLTYGETIELSTEEIRTPIEVGTLTECCLELMTVDFEGIIHLGSSDSLSRYKIGLKYAIKAGFDKALLVPASGSTPGKAPRHKRGVLDISKAANTLETPLLNIKSFIDKIVISKYKI